MRGRSPVGYRGGPGRDAPYRGRSRSPPRSHPAAGHRSQHYDEPPVGRSYPADDWRAPPPTFREPSTRGPPPSLRQGARRSRSRSPPPHLPPPRSYAEPAYPRASGPPPPAASAAPRSRSILPRLIRESNLHYDIKLAIEDQMLKGRLETGHVLNSNVQGLEQMPVHLAVEAVYEFGRLDKNRIHFPAAFFTGVMKRMLQKHQDEGGRIALTDRDADRSYPREGGPPAAARRGSAFDDREAEHYDDRDAAYRGRPDAYEDDPRYGRPAAPGGRMSSAVVSDRHAERDRIVPPRSGVAANGRDDRYYDEVRAGGREPALPSRRDPLDDLRGPPRRPMDDFDRPASGSRYADDRLGGAAPRSQPPPSRYDDLPPMRGRSPPRRDDYLDPRDRGFSSRDRPPFDGPRGGAMDRGYPSGRRQSPPPPMTRGPGPMERMGPPPMSRPVMPMVREPPPLPMPRRRQSSPPSKGGAGAGGRHHVRSAVVPAKDENGGERQVMDNKEMTPIADTDQDMAAKEENGNAAHTDDSPPVFMDTDHSADQLGVDVGGNTGGSVTGDVQEEGGKTGEPTMVDELLAAGDGDDAWDGRANQLYEGDGAFDMSNLVDKKQVEQDLKK